MRFNQARGRQVVSTSTAETLGSVGGFVVDPARRAVTAVELEGASGGKVVRWRDLTAFGDDAVTIASDESLSEPDEELDALRGKERKILGKRVLTTAGDELGSVEDVEFEADTGTIAALVLGDSEVAGSRLVGVGSYAVVVDHAP